MTVNAATGTLPLPVSASATQNISVGAAGATFNVVNRFATMNLAGTVGSTGAANLTKTGLGKVAIAGPVNLNGGVATGAADENVKAYGDFYDTTLQLMKSSDLKAFDLGGEPARVARHRAHRLEPRQLLGLDAAQLARIFGGPPAPAPQSGHGALQLAQRPTLVALMTRLENATGG